MPTRKPQKTFQLWVYVIRWIDGDTFKGIIDQGFHHYLGTLEDPISMRCAFINSPELKTGRPGDAAREYAETLVPVGQWYPCYSYKPDEYGRPLMDVIVNNSRFSDAMVASGHAVLYKR